MRRVLIRLWQVVCVVALTWGVLGISGCIPAFRGFKNITRADLKPKAKSSAAAEILQWDDYYRPRWSQVGSRYSVFWRRHMRIRYNKRSSFKHAQWTIRGSLLSLDVRTVCPDGRVLRLGKREVEEATQKTYPTTKQWDDDNNSYKVMAPGVGVGCIVDVMWEADVMTAPTAMKWKIQRQFVIQRGSLTYDYPALNVHRARLRNMDHLWIRLAKSHMGKKAHKKSGAEKVVAKSVKSELKKKFNKEYHVKVRHERFNRRIKVTLRDIPAAWNPRIASRMVKAKMLPARFGKAPVLDVDIIRTHGIGGRDLMVSWRNVDESFTAPSFVFYDTRTRKQRNYQCDEKEESDTGDKSLTKIARGIAGSGSSQAKIKAIYNHLRQRMTKTKASTSSSLKLTKVYQIKRGTTYEINMIFIVMLRSLGIRAYLALVAPGNRKNFPADEPNDVSRTVATYIPSSGGKWRGLSDECSAGKDFLSKKGSDYQGGRKVTNGVLVDPSNRFLSYGTLPDSLSNIWAFVIDRAGGQFFKTPEVKAAKNRRQYDVRATLNKDGSGKGTVTISLWGASAMTARHLFLATPRHMWETKLAGMMVRMACGKQTQVSFATAPDISGAKLQEPFRYSYNFTAPSCLAHGKNHLLFRPFPAPLLGAKKLSGGKRMAPIALGTPGNTAVSVDLTLPSGYKLLTNLPAKMAVNAPAISLTSAITSSTGKMKLSYNYVRQKREIPASSYTKMRPYFMSLFLASKAVALVGPRRVQ